MSIRILVVDDHQLIRQGLVALLEQHEEVEIIGQASHGREAVEMATRLKPDVVVMDLAMPELNGIEATSRIVHNLPGTRVVVLSARNDTGAVRAAIDAGASAFVPKLGAIDELRAAVDAAARGETYLGPEIARRLVSEPTPAGAGGTRPLSPREREMIQLLAEGKATKEAAMAMGVSVKTAETYRRSLMEKLNASSVAELTKYAIREGLTTLDT